MFSAMAVMWLPFLTQIVARKEITEWPMAWKGKGKGKCKGKHKHWKGCEPNASDESKVDVPAAAASAASPDPLPGDTDGAPFGQGPVPGNPWKLLSTLRMLKESGFLAPAIFSSLAVQWLPFMTQIAAQKVETINRMAQEGLDPSLQKMLEIIQDFYGLAAKTPGLEPHAALIAEALSGDNGQRRLGDALLEFLKALQELGPQASATAAMSEDELEAKVLQLLELQLASEEVIRDLLIANDGDVAKVRQAPEAQGQNISDAVTSAMMNQFARELTSSSMSLWPQFVQTTRRYFNVHHGYVLRKILWQLIPFHSTKKKSSDGELGGDKDWTVRVIDGLEVDIEEQMQMTEKHEQEPDLYIPTMGFVTYVVLFGMVRGVQADFSPEVLSATISSTLVVLILELALMKGALFMSGAVNTPTLDLFALLGYKFLYLSLHVGLGLLLGHGATPSGFIYRLLTLGLTGSCAVALWQDGLCHGHPFTLPKSCSPPRLQALRRLARLQPAHGQECVTDMHQMCIKASIKATPTPLIPHKTPLPQGAPAPSSLCMLVLAAILAEDSSSGGGSQSDNCCYSCCLSDERWSFFDLRSPHELHRMRRIFGFIGGKGSPGDVVKDACGRAEELEEQPRTDALVSCLSRCPENCFGLIAFCTDAMETQLAKKDFDATAETVLANAMDPPLEIESLKLPTCPSWIDYGKPGSEDKEPDSASPVVPALIWQEGVGPEGSHQPKNDLQENRVVVLQLLVTLLSGGAPTAPILQETGAAYGRRICSFPYFQYLWATTHMASAYRMADTSLEPSRKLLHTFAFRLLDCSCKMSAMPPSPEATSCADKLCQELLVSRKSIPEEGHEGDRIQHAFREILSNISSAREVEFMVDGVITLLGTVSKDGSSRREGELPTELHEAAALFAGASDPGFSPHVLSKVHLSSDRAKLLRSTDRPGAPIALLGVHFEAEDIVGLIEGVLLAASQAPEHVCETTLSLIEAAILLNITSYREVCAELDEEIHLFQDYEGNVPESIPDFEGSVADLVAMAALAQASEFLNKSKASTVHDSIVQMSFATVVNVSTFADGLCMEVFSLFERCAKAVQLKRSRPGVANHLPMLLEVFDNALQCARRSRLICHRFGQTLEENENAREQNRQWQEAVEAHLLPIAGLLEVTVPVLEAEVEKHEISNSEEAKELLPRCILGLMPPPHAFQMRHLRRCAATHIACEHILAASLGVDAERVGGANEGVEENAREK
eukprot:g21525.t1